MKKENFLELLKRNSPKEILDFISRKGKTKKSVNALVFFDNNNKK